MYVPPLLYAKIRFIIDKFQFRRLPTCAQGYKNNHRHTQIFINGLDGKTFVLNVRLGNDVKDIKGMIREEKGIPVKKQRLVYGGKQMLDGTKLFEYNIQKESTLHLCLRLRGGMLHDKVRDFDGMHFVETNK